MTDDMNIDPTNRSNDDVVKEILRPMEELLARDDDELKKLDQLIGEAERNCKRMLHPES